MTERANAEVEFPPLEVLILDEAQDFTPLQWSVIYKMVDKVKRIYLAGDDDQGIYKWNGADPKLTECKQIQVSRQFENFEEFWNITSSSHSMSLVFKKLTLQLISDIRLSVEKVCNQESSEPLKIQAHVNAIKGFV